MSYATLADLYDRFGQDEILQLTDVDRGGVPDEATVARAQADADAEIDAALVARYQLPLSPVPTILVRIACDLMRESFYTNSVPDVVKDRAAVARRLLASIARGDTNLQAPAAAAGAVKSDARITHRRQRMRWPSGQGGGLC